MMLTTILLAGVQAAPALNCADPQAQVEMNLCAGRAFERADADLNREYREHVSRARAADAEPGRTGPGRHQALLESQRAWLRYRDTECERMTLQYWGGSIAPLIHATCRTDLTRARIAQLRDGIED